MKEVPAEKKKGVAGSGGRKGGKLSMRGGRRFLGKSATKKKKRGDKRGVGCGSTFWGKKRLAESEGKGNVHYHRTGVLGELKIVDQMCCVRKGPDGK